MAHFPCCAASPGHLDRILQRASFLTLILGLHSGLTHVQAVVNLDADRSESNRLLTIDAIRHMTNQQKEGNNRLQDTAGGQVQRQQDVAPAQAASTNKRLKPSHQQMLDQYNQRLWREAELEAEQESRSENQMRQQRMLQKKALERGPEPQQKSPQPQPGQTLLGMLRLCWNTASRAQVCQALGLCLVGLCLAASRFLTCPSRCSRRSEVTSKAPSLGVAARHTPSEDEQCEEGGDNKSLYLYELTSRKYPDLEELKGDLDARLQAIAKKGRGSVVFAVGSGPPSEMASSCAQQ